jgi:hypothetical protein
MINVRICGAVAVHWITDAQLPWSTNDSSRLRLIDTLCPQLLCTVILFRPECHILYLALSANEAQFDTGGNITHGKLIHNTSQIATRLNRGGLLKKIHSCDTFYSGLIERVSLKFEKSFISTGTRTLNEGFEFLSKPVFRCWPAYS